MATNITLLNYNNYFNRIIKKESTLAAYKALDSNYTDIASVNFNPADGVNTELVVGTSSIPHNYDYLIVWDDSNSSITSRWFIMDEDRTRGGQYHLTLRRDVIIDHYDDIKNAPTFIEKGIITDVNDPLIYNKENMTYNQIKQSETLLKDATGMPWLIGYVSQDKARYPESGYYESKAPIENVTAWADVPQSVKNFLGNDYNIIQNPSASLYNGLKYRFYATRYTNSYSRFYYNTDTSTWSWDDSWTTGSPTYDDLAIVSSAGGTPAAAAQAYLTGSNAYNFHNRIAELFRANVSSILSAYCSATGYITTPVDFSVIDAWNGRYIYDQNNTLVKIKVNHGEIQDGAYWGFYSNSTTGTQFKTAISTTISEQGASPYLSAGNGTSSPYVRLCFPVQRTQVRTEAVSSTATSTVKTYIPANRMQVRQAPYDIFAIPYYDCVVKNGSTTIVTMNTEIASQAATALAQAGNNCYDIQLLPYFPDQNQVGIAIGAGQIDISKLTEDQSFNYIKNESDGNIGVVLWVRNSECTFDIPISMSIPKEGTNPTAEELKVANECDLYRLVSPNYSGQFEFSLAKNGGSISKVNVDCTFKPYTPYIHINPDFKGLYGQDFNDARGLICGGDFSIARVTDAWQAYQLNNKNYQQIFDRQIQNLDVNNAINKQEAIFQAATGVITGAASGAATGAMAGGGWGAAAGAVLGGAAGAIGGIMDIKNLEKRQEETRSYQVDMYGYNLGNIQALPQSLARTSAISYNNKLYPMIEYYTCTDREKQILKNKLLYNGMTIMSIGNLSSFTGFVKGQIIRLPDLKEDNHMANAIYEEINKGVYL